MKKLRALVIGIVLIIVVLIAGSRILIQSSGMSGAKVINIYNWGDYIDPELISEFEKSVDELQEAADIKKLQQEAFKL